METNGPVSQCCPTQRQKEMLLRAHKWTQLPPVALSSSPFWPSTSKVCGYQLPDEQNGHYDHLCVWICGISLHRSTGGEALLCPETDLSHQGLLFASRSVTFKSSRPLLPQRKEQCPAGGLTTSPPYDPNNTARPRRPPTPPASDPAKMAAAALRLSAAPATSRAREPRPRACAGQERGGRAAGAESLAALWRGRGGRTHVSAGTTRRLPGSCRVRRADWPVGEPFTFYPPSAANRAAPFTARRWGACELRRAEFSERACVAGVGRPPLVWVGGLGEVLRLRRAGGVRGGAGRGRRPRGGPGEWRNLTAGGSAAAAGKWRRRRHNETRPVAGGRAGPPPVTAGRRWRPRPGPAGA